MTPATITNAVRRVIPTLSSADLDRVQHAVAEAMIPMRGRLENADRLLRRAYPWVGVEWRADSSDDECRRILNDIEKHLVAGVKKETR